jgi:hypothetical protein
VKVFCNAKQVAFPVEEKTAKCDCRYQAWVRCYVFIAFGMITNRYAASLLPQSGVFETILTTCKASVLKAYFQFSMLKN